MTAVRRALFLACLLLAFPVEQGWTNENTPDSSYNPKAGPGTNGTNGPSVGDPIVIGSGDASYQVTDYETPGPNRLSFTRFYTSGGAEGAFAIALGRNWRSTYDRYLRIAFAGQRPVTVSAEREDGSVIKFARKGEVWVSDGDRDFKLTQQGAAWTMTCPDDSVETYTSGGPGQGLAPTVQEGYFALVATYAAGSPLLTSIQKRNGYRQTLQYDAGNRLSSITDSFGRVLRLTYDNKLLATMTSPDGLIVTYTYGSSGAKPGVDDRLASVSYSSTPTSKQSYVYENRDLPFALTGVIDEDGNRYASWSYDWLGRATSIEHAGGANLTKVAYDVADRSRTVTNSLGAQTVYKYDVVHGRERVTEVDRLATRDVPAAVRRIAYDANGFVAEKTDWNGHVKKYVNDSRGLPTRISEAVGTPDERTTVIEWHPKFHLPTKIATLGLTTSFSYDASGNLLSRTQTDTTTTDVPYSTNGLKKTWTYTWSNGLLTSVRGPRDDVTAITALAYDSSGALVSITNALGQVVHITAHLPGGAPTNFTDRNGVSRERAFDARARLLTATTVTRAGRRTFSFTFDPAGNLTRATRPDGSAFAFAYDTAGRLSSLSDLFGQRIDFGLDALDDITELETLAVGGTTPMLRRAASFDALGRVATLATGTDEVTSLGYNAGGDVTTVTDPLGHVTRPSFDTRGRPIKIIDAANGVTAIAYDARNRPVGITDPKGNSTRYTYDGFGDLIQTVSPDTGTTVYRYDLGGNLVQSVDAAGVLVNHTYDALNRRVSTTYPAHPADDVSYTYDQGAFGVGRLTSVKDAAGVLQREYDEEGDVVQEVRTRGAVRLVVSYNYDAARRLLSITYPSGAKVVYARDAMGRVISVSLLEPGAEVARPVALDIGYSPFGPATRLTYGNGVQETRELDLNGRVTRITTAGKAPIEEWTYGFDAAGNVVSIAAANPANRQEFGYDALDRLVSAKGDYGALAYAYDAVGNRTAVSSSTATNQICVYAPNSNRLVEMRTDRATLAVAYAPTGRITDIAATAADSATRLGYNDAGRLVRVIVGDRIVADYVYDAFGKRIAKTLPNAGGETIFQYGPVRRLLEEADATGAALIDYIYLGNRPIAMFSPKSGALFFLHGDRLGTPRIATADDQGIAWRTNFAPFGAAEVRSAAIEQNLRFPGQYFDRETGFYQNGFRDYDPSLGRYLESDLLGLRGGINTYAYALENPLGHVDRLGLSTSSSTTGTNVYGMAMDPMNGAGNNQRTNFRTNTTSRTSETSNSGGDSEIPTNETDELDIDFGDEDDSQYVGRIKEINQTGNEQEGDQMRPNPNEGEEEENGTASDETVLATAGRTALVLGPPLLSTWLVLAKISALEDELDNALAFDATSPEAVENTAINSLAITAAAVIIIILLAPVGA
jgi:RHS repeat-associated protein